MILDAHGRPVEVEPIPYKPRESEWEKLQQKNIKAALDAEFKRWHNTHLRVVI